MRKIVIQTTIATVLMFLALEVKAQNQTITTKPRPVEMESEFKPHMGVIFGASQPEGSGMASGDIGLELGFQPYIPFGLGVEYIHSRIDLGNELQDRDTVWLKGSYNFAGDNAFLRYTYVGVAAGAVMKGDGTSIAGAPLVGFDIPMHGDYQNTMGTFSLGANARYAIVGDNDTDTFSLAGVVKYWF